MARTSCFSLSLSFLFFFFFLLLLRAETKVVEGEKNQLVVGDVGSGNSQKEGRVECKKNEMQCKEGNGGVEESSVFETGDYIYTNSNP